MREALRGLHPDTEELNKEVMYWYFAHHFGWMPQQVDRQYPDRLAYLRELEEEYKKLEKESIKTK